MINHRQHIIQLTFHLLFFGRFRPLRNESASDIPTSSCPAERPVPMWGVTNNWHFELVFYGAQRNTVQYINTVDGRNPAPVEVGSLSQYLQCFFTSQVVVWDFFHQQYHYHAPILSKRSKRWLFSSNATIRWILWSTRKLMDPFTFWFSRFPLQPDLCLKAHDLDSIYRSLSDHPGCQWWKVKLKLEIRFYNSEKSPFILGVPGCSWLGYPGRKIITKI